MPIFPATNMLEYGPGLHTGLKLDTASKKNFQLICFIILYLKDHFAKRKTDKINDYYYDYYFYYFHVFTIITISALTTQIVNISEHVDSRIEEKERER